MTKWLTHKRFDKFHKKAFNLLRLLCPIHRPSNDSHHWRRPYQIRISRKLRSDGEAWEWWGALCLPTRHTVICSNILGYCDAVNVYNYNAKFSFIRVGSKAHTLRLFLCLLIWCFILDCSWRSRPNYVQYIFKYLHSSFIEWGSYVITLLSCN